MLFEIEIGSENEKSLIKRELESFLSIFGIDFIKQIKLSKIIIPIDFDKTVNRYENIDLGNYTFKTSNKIVKSYYQVIL